MTTDQIAVSSSIGFGAFVLKRALDLLLASMLSLLTFPIVGVLCVLIWLETRATPIFTQRRVGADGQVFVMYKLRTMKPGTADSPSHEVSSTAVTRTGKLLRNYKLDELPQLWNVVEGNMSFVGPRPCLPSQSELISYRAALGIDGLKPGITGPGQLSGVDMSAPLVLARMDASYMDYAVSCRTDLKWIVSTLGKQGHGDAVQDD